MDRTGPRWAATPPSTVRTSGTGTKALQGGKRIEVDSADSTLSLAACPLHHPCTGVEHRLGQGCAGGAGGNPLPFGMRDQCRPNRFRPPLPPSNRFTTAHL